VALYRGTPEDFIASRDALVRDLRAQGDDDLAKDVKALRKPTVLAWAMNQLADRDPEGVEALLETGAELRAAQRATLSGGDAERLRKATAARRRAVVQLTRAAVGVLSGSGREADPHVEDLTSALEAAAVDTEAGEGLRLGILERPPRPEAGFGDLGSLAAVPERRTPEPAVPEIRRPDHRELRRRRDAERKRAQRERATADDLARQVAAAESQLEKLRERQADAEGRAKAADLDARRTERDLKKADEPG